MQSLNICDDFANRRASIGLGAVTNTTAQVRQFWNVQFAKLPFFTAASRTQMVSRDRQLSSHLFG